MRIVCISDTHLQEPPLPDGDLLIHAGDLTFRGNEHEIRLAACWLGEQAKRYPKGVMAIAGNHDWLFERDPALAQRIIEEAGIVYLQDSGCIVDGYQIWGSPWQPEFCNWAFNLSRMDSSLAEKWAAIPDDTDILITHGPPKDILDGVPRFRGGPWEPVPVGIEHVGCFDLRERVLKLKPKLHIFGHIHCAYGELEFNGTRFVNAALCDETYDATNAPIVVDI